MPVVLEKYGPVLDPTIEVVKELVTHGSADLHVPEHPEALGMAVDIQSLLYRLYNFIDSEIFVPYRRPIILRGKEQEGIESFLFRLKVERDGFEVSEQETFSEYPHSTILDLSESERGKIDYGSKVSISAGDMPINSRFGNTPFVSIFYRRGITLPIQRKKIKIDIGYHGVGKFPARTFFQDFRPTGKFTRKRINDEGFKYPVSSKSIHELDYRSWNFFKQPPYWSSWSSYLSMAFNKLTGLITYEKEAEHYSHDTKRVIEHGLKAEPIVIRLLRGAVEKEDISQVTDSVECPPAYRGIYLEKILRTIGWLCNPNSLQDAEKRGYLENLATNCKAYGFNVTPEILVASVTSYRRQQTL